MLRDWAKLVSYSIRRPTQGPGGGVPANTLAEWPLLRRSVRKGTVGGASVDNMFWIAAFDRLLSSAPRLGPCFFLSEMQGWEVALMSSWFRLQTTPIVGVQHSTVAFWDMRYALGPKVLAHVRAGSCEAQYRLAVNGPLAMRHLLEDGYAESELVETEALRYLDLRRVAGLKNAAPSLRGPGRFGLLLCGEYDERATARLVNTVSAALSSLQLPPRVIFRPHPGSPVRVPDGRIEGQYEVVRADLSDLLGQAQLVVCGSVSSVAIDGLLYGRTVAVLRDPRCFPGPAASELQLINSAGELADVILQADSQVASGGSEGHDPTVWFCLDSSMSRWRGLVQWALGRAS
jgi:surface carbohydrate biosynthesis protein (TIGR04326 family)